MNNNSLDMPAMWVWMAARADDRIALERLNSNVTVADILAVKQSAASLAHTPDREQR